MKFALWIPKLSHFQNKNGWTGSMGRMEYEILPPDDQGVLAVTLWYGPFRLEYAQIVAQSQFQMSESGVEELYQWLLAQGIEMNESPQQSEADCLTYYRHCRDKEKPVVPQPKPETV